MQDHQLDLTKEDLELLKERKQIVDFDEQPVRSDHAHLQVVRFTVRAPKASIDRIRTELAERVFVDESDPPAKGVDLPMKG